MFRTIIYANSRQRVREIAYEMYCQIEQVFAHGVVKCTCNSIDTPLFRVEVYELRLGFHAERGRRCDMIVIDDGIELTEEDYDYVEHITHLNSNRFTLAKYRNYKQLPMTKFVGVENSIDNGYDYYGEWNKITVL